jgi:two-component system, cell cycle response regulator
MNPGRLASQSVEDLTAENRRLSATLNKLTEESARNAAVLRKTQERELELLRARSLHELLERLVQGLRVSHKLDVVTLTLLDPEHEIRHLLNFAGLEQPDTLRDINFVDDLKPLLPPQVALERPWLGMYQKEMHGGLVRRMARNGSVALLPLRRSEKLDGVLLFGSADAQRFNPQLGSDFLEHLGLVAAFCLENAINRARLLRSGFTDFLTGFHNRRYLDARLREELARAQRTQQPLACLMIDIDYFKRINDQYGHLAGDKVLREVARRIESQMRLSDCGARFGGDEFAIILPQAGAAEAERLAARILASLTVHGLELAPQVTETISLSVGVAAALPDPQVRDYSLLTEQLLNEADTALYRAKMAGRNRIEVSASLLS